MPDGSMIPTTLVFGWENFAELLREPNLRDLLRAHWEELAVHKERMPLDPDFETMLALEKAGRFRVWTARAGATLAGYIAFHIVYPLHYKSTLTAVEDLYLLAPPWRRGANGVRLFTSALAALDALGVQRVILHDKTHFQAQRGGLGKLFLRLGFTHTDNLWSRMVGDGQS